MFYLLYLVFNSTKKTKRFLKKKPNTDILKKVFDELFKTNKSI